MAAIPFLHQIIRAGRLAARHLAGIVPDPSLQRIWTETFVWWPVLPNDEPGLFWLESVWHRRHRKTQRWEYRSFRTDTEKMRDVAKQNDLPPLGPLNLRPVQFYTMEIVQCSRQLYGVAIGGAVGSVARYWVALWMLPLSRDLPWGTMLINVVGSFVISFFGTLTVEHGRYASPSSGASP